MESVSSEGGNPCLLAILEVPLLPGSEDLPLSAALMSPLEEAINSGPLCVFILLKLLDQTFLGLDTCVHLIDFLLLARGVLLVVHLVLLNILTPHLGILCDKLTLECLKDLVV